MAGGLGRGRKSTGSLGDPALDREPRAASGHAVRAGWRLPTLTHAARAETGTTIGPAPVGGVRGGVV